MKKILGTGMIAVILYFTLSGYFTQLSQYATADQEQFALPQVKKFLESPAGIEIEKQYHVTYLLSLPGKIIDKAFSANHTADDFFIGSLYYTPILPYELVHVIFTLIFLLSCVYLLGRLLDLNIKKDFIFYGFIAVMFLNYPTLTGVSKVFTYDAFSTSFSILAVLLYLVSIKRNKKKYLIFSIVFCSLAYIEKVTTFSIAFMILFFETIRISFQPGEDKVILKQLGKFVLLFIIIFLGVMFICIPALWFDPSKISILLAFFFGWFFGFLDITFQIIGIFIIILLWFGIRILVSQRTMTSNFLQKIPVKKIYLASLVSGMVIFFCALIFQDSNMVDMATANPELLSRIKKENYFVSSDQMANASISTLDKSGVSTRIKVLFNNARLFYYVTPEVIVFMFLSVPFFLFLLYKKKRIGSDSTIILLLTLIPILLLLAFSLLVAPVHPRYNLLPYLFIIILSIFTWVKYLKTATSHFSRILLIALPLLMLPSMTGASPAYFTYMNLFRNKTIENSEFLNFDKATWTYVGWGESSYPCFNFIAQHTSKPVKILYDYTLPFHYDKKIKPFFSAQCRNRYLPFGKIQLLDMLSQLDKGGIEYIVITKVVAYRSAINNYIISMYRRKAVFVDKVCGVEYGWVFRTKDLLNQIQQK